MNKLKKILKNKSRLLPLLFLFVVFVVSNITFLLTFAEDTSSFVEDPDYLESKVLDNKVYVNDLKNDYYYYMGLNYTTNDGHIPTKENKNIYNENNLVEVKTVYSSHDEKDLTGYVSINERQDTYVYFNTFVVNDNNTPNDLTDDYIDYVLIDNPFTNRPTDQGFNGWTTQYRGAFVYYDDEYYERHVKIPISYSNNKPNKIDITFNASWVDATIYYTNGSFSDINSNIKQKNMEKIKIVTVKYDDYNMYGYYKSVLVGAWESLSGYYGINGNSYGGWSMCTSRSTEWNGNGCLVYQKITTNENFNENTDYYELRNRRMQKVTAEDLGITSTTIVSTKYNNSNMSGYYFKVSLNYGDSTDNYYSNLGKRLSGTCNNYYGCEVYELIQYYDSEGVSNLFNSDNEYYYLVTRDTNIVVINDDISSSFSNNQNYPFTITGIHNGVNYNSVWNVNSSINCYDDMTIENVMLSYNGYISDRQEVNPSTNTNTSGVLFIRYNNVKVGRNITISNNNFSLRSIVGGNNSSTGSNGNPTKYKIIIESGKYASFSLSGGAQTGTGGNSLYLNNKATYGNDYDRVSNNLNNLIVTFCAAGSWGSRVYANTNSTTSKDVSFDLTVKSGSFGTGKIDLTTGIYVGGRYGGTQYAVRKVKVEGGYIYNLIGGPVSASNRSNYNDIYIYMTGGTVDMITGGAGKSATYGNRIVQVTGGLVNYSVFGGSNGNDGSGTDGTLNGSTYVYIGGNATIGSETLINNGSTLWGSEAGSVFGNGNGNTSSDSIGSCENSTILIDEKALVNKNVYGGGNYGATGVSSTSNSSKTDIVIYNGTIKGSIFGGGNQNGAGDNYKTAHINIEMYNGVIATSLYGGSNIKGTIYGDVNILMAGGEISNSLYGGGKGGVSTNNPGTYVRDDVNVVIGNDTNSFIPIINGSVYGGSEAGSVNGNSITSTVSVATTNVTVNKGIINNVFGGGQGSKSETPYVFGNIFVTVNDGTINNVFGGNDKSGKPNGDITVTINGGQINSTYGGGNETGANTTKVYLNGGVSTKIFGGSNLLGEVTTSNVITTGGESTLVYGGNNKGGTTNTTNITINDGNIATVYGGGDETSVINRTNVIINNNVSTVFGGSNKLGDIPLSNITVNNGNTNNIYGGNNEGGLTSVSNISINGGLHKNVFGGGLKVDTTTTNINANKGYITNLFGAGNEAGATTTNINIGKSVIQNVFGSSNMSGDVDTSNIKSIEVDGVNDLLEANVTFDTSSQSNSQYQSSENIKVNIKNNSNVTITKWDMYITTSDSVLGADWSSATINCDNSVYHVNEKNKYYGTNTIGPSSNYSFDFHVFSNVSYDEFAIKEVILFGYDDSGNLYTTKAKVTNLYGGNNEGGITRNANILLTSGVVTNLYGGGNKAETTNTNIDISNTLIESSFFGGGNEASVETVSAKVKSSTIGSTSNDAKMFGGGNKARINDKISFTISDNTQVYGSVFGGGNLGEVENTVTLTINDSIISNDIYGSGNLASVGKVEKDTISLNLNNISAKTVYGGGNAALTNGNVNLIINNSNITDSIYGAGNGLDSIVPGDETGKDNPAKVNGNTNLTITNTTVNNVYGGGNLGFVNKSTYVKLDSSTVTDSIYGGGNAAVVLNNTYLYVTNSKVLDSVYAGGNGVKAIVEGNTNLDIDNNSEITNHVFGGGNAAQTGTKDKNSSTGIVNIVGAIIGKNVYGGANTSVLYGETTVNIGSNTSLNNNLISSDIQIGGTVFGGGEANAAGSEIYDFSFISVTKGINININAKNHQVFLINGSIFGSGNASSTSGYSYININNYGTSDSVKRNVSIQRANVVTLNNSYILLSGAKDRTNEYSDVLFTLSRLDNLKLKNSSSLYLETGANLVKKFVSAVDVNGNEEIATVTIDNDNNTFARNTNNRIYMLEGKNLNIAKNENVTEYGEVLGMTFFGMFSLDRNKNIITALYSDYGYNEVVSSGDIYYFTNGSYVLGRHTTNHDITKNGFYSNYGNEEGNRVVIKYIEPTPQDTQFYMWTIGEVVASYEVTLTASKYSTLGAQEVPLINHTDNNTTFSILGVNFSNLDENVRLVDYKDIPRVAKTSEEADTVFGLNMKNGTVGWTNDGSTNFITDGNVNVVGTKDYIRENINNVPALVFYFYHSKNLSTSGQLGSVTISLVAITRIDDLNNKVERINININLTKALYNSNDYEGTITPGKQYEMFATSETNISNRSSFSTYYSLFMESENTPYKSGYHRSLVSTYVLPVNTKITMIDLHDVSNPEYYYYTINESDYNASIEEYNMYGEASYKLSNFIKMGSTSSNNTYNDSEHNMKYYNESTNTAEEEFIFMVDFKDTVISEDVLSKTLLIELRNSDEQTLIGVLGIEQQTLKYNIYTESDAYIGLVGNISKNTVYLGNTTNLIIDSSYMEKEKNGVKVKDTTFGEDKVGLMISIIDKNGNVLSAQDLFGLSFKYMGVSYYPSSNGITRIKLSDKVSNIRSIITLDTGTSSLATGEYTILINSFGSVDGIYYGVSTLMETSLKVKIIDTPYGLKTNSQNNYIFVDKDTGITLVGNDSYLLNVSYESNLDNPNLRIKLQRRDYKDIYSLKYTDVDLMDYVSNDYRKTSVNNLYYLSTNPVSDVQYNLHMKSNLVTGTYRIVVSLYDNDNYIGEVYEYMIIK